MHDQQSAQVLPAQRPRSAIFLASTWLMLVLGVLGAGWEAFASFASIYVGVTTTQADELHGLYLFAVPALASFGLFAATATHAVKTLLRRSRQQYEAADNARGWAGVCLLLGFILFCCSPAQPWYLFVSH